MTGSGRPLPGKKMRNVLNRLLRGRKPNAHRRPLGQRIQSFQRKRQMYAALVVGDGVNFIDDHGLHIAQNRAALFRRQQNVEATPA